MTPPDEIVCETAAAFHAKLRTHHGIALYGNPVNPGDSVTLGGITVVYRPPAPKPECAYYPHPEFVKVLSGQYAGVAKDSVHRAVAWTPGGAPIVGIDMKVIGALDWFPAPPPPPVDAAREAFDRWWAEDLNPPPSSFAEDARKKAFGRAFLAGRASVKP